MSNCRAIVIVWLAICLALSAGCALFAPPPRPDPPPVVVECPRLPPPPPMPEPIQSDYLSRTESVYSELLQRLMPLLCRPASSEPGSGQ